MSEINRPHDRFFHLVFSQEEHARDLLRNALPNSILRMLDLSSLEISRESYIDEKLATRQSDILIRTRIRDSPVLVYILVEHKSYSYRWTMLQLLAYMVRIWEKELSQNKKLKKLPLIIPVIFYHGSGKWKPPLDFSSYIDLGEELRSYIPGFRAVMFNLQQLGDTDLRGAVLFQAAMKIFKYALTMLRQHVGEIARDLLTLPFDERNETFLKGALEYIMQVGEDIELSDVEEELQRAGSEDMREAYMTLAEQLIAKGKNEGKLEGKREGKLEGKLEGKREGKLEGKLEGQTLAKQQVLLRLLEKKFGLVDDPEKRKIRNCRDRDRLDQAIDLVLDADSIDRVLDSLE